MGQIDKAVWLVRFAVELQRIRPLTEAPAASQAASETYDMANRLVPETAAGVYAKVLDEELGAPD